MALETAESKQEAVVAAWTEAIDGNWDTFDDVFAEDVHYEDPNTELDGRDAVKEYIQEWLDAFPDFEGTFLDVAGDDDVVMAYFSTKGTHEGELQGVPATGNSFEGIAMSMDRFEDGKIVEEINVWDTLDFLQQVEIDPSEF